MQVKKLFTLLAFLGIAASASAQVTFSYDDGENSGTWAGMETEPWDENASSKFWRANPSDHTYLIIKASEATYIQGYSIVLPSNSQTDGRLPYTWTLYGSNDKTVNDWVPIHSQAQANNITDDFDDANISVSNKEYTYYCNTGTQYQYYKLNITAKERGGWGCFEIAEIKLIPSNVGFIGTGDATDGDTGTKLGDNVTKTIVVESTASTTIKGYQFTTANDTQTYPGMNPNNWTLEGSDDNSTWTTIDTKTDFSVMEGKNYYPYAFILNNDSQYKYYRFTITGVQSGNYLQLSEVALITDPTDSTDGICEIKDPSDLIAFSGNVNAGKTRYNGVLTDDIDMSETSYTPIGTVAYKYKGTFNGQGHSVNLNINSTGINQGLFGYATGGAEFKNVIVKGTINCGASSAALVGEVRDGTIKINHVGCEATVNGGTAYRIGAFVGNDWGHSTVIKIENSYNIGNITGDSNLTSVVGCHPKGGSSFENVYNKGTISSGNFYYDAYPGTVCTNCYTTENGNSGVSGLETQVQPNQVTSGELCAKLGYAFRQTLGTGYPCFDKTKGFVTKIGSARYSTQYITDSDVTIPDGVEAYAGVINGDEWLHLAPITEKIKSSEPVILKLAEGTEAGLFNFMPTTGASAAESNDLKGSTGNVTGDGSSYYALSTLGGTEPIGFYLVNSGVKIPEGRAYLEISGGSGVKGFTFIFDEDATSINEELRMKNEESEASIFNLAGQRINKMQKGINIVNGKKVMF